MLRFGPASEWLLWPLPALLSPFAAVFYPLATLPQWMQVDRARSAARPTCSKECAACSAARRIPARCLLQGAAVAAIELLLAAYFYGRVYRHAVRSGLLARYSAEGAA